jgi:hypothetical protein
MKHTAYFSPLKGAGLKISPISAAFTAIVRAGCLVLFDTAPSLATKQTKPELCIPHSQLFGDKQENNAVLRG